MGRRIKPGHGSQNAPCFAYDVSAAGTEDTLVALQTMSRQQEKNRSQRKERLAAMGEMAAKMAHEIRNPLGSIELFATSLQASLADQPDLQVLAERISSGVRSIDAIISNLLLYLRPNEVKHTTCFDIYEVLDDVLFFMNHMAAMEDDIRVKLAWGHRPLFVNGDVELMKQVCLNLILNAIQSMPEGGDLGIATVQKTCPREHDPGWMEIRISDTGAGIEPQHIPKIFDPFFTTKPSGTGLGLSIVHNIVEMHGGNIDVASTPGSGTVFSIGLPLCVEAAAIGESTAHPAMAKEASA